jgi:hypothetical protein
MRVDGVEGESGVRRSDLPRVGPWGPADRREAIFREDQDREVFLRTLSEVCSRRAGGCMRGC